MPTTRGAGRPASAAASRARSLAARIISRPPDAWTSRIDAPVRAAAAAAAPTVFGMSCSLRSRNTGAPRATTSRTSSGPWEVKASRPILKTPTSGRRSRAAARRSSRRSRSRATAILSRGSGIGVLRAGPRLERPDDVRDPRLAVRGAPIGDTGDQLSRHGRVAEVRGADLDGVGAGHQELDDVLGPLDAADPEDRDLGHRPPDLPHHPDGHRTYRGAGKSPGREPDL